MAKKSKSKSKPNPRFPYRTLIITGFLVAIVIIFAVIIIPTQPPETVEINGCEFPPNPVIGSKVDFEIYITKNQGFFKGTGEPVVLDYVPEQGRLEQLRVSALCAIQNQFPDMSEDRALCWTKTINLPPNPSDIQLEDAQEYCLKSEQESAENVEAYKQHRGMLGNLQTLLRKDPAADFSLMLGPQGAEDLTNMWIRRTAVLGDYADLIDKICTDPLNACLSCDIRDIERRAVITLNAPTETCQHPAGGEFLRCAGISTAEPDAEAQEGESALPSCEP